MVLILLILFPQIALWLPNLLLRDRNPFTPKEPPVSFDLVILPQSMAADAGRAITLLQEFSNRSYSDKTKRKPTGVLSEFYDRLVVRYPELSSLTDDELDRSPWSMDILGPWDDHLSLTMSWPSVPAAPEFILKLAYEVGVCVFDPQVSILYRPPGAPDTWSGSVISPHLLIPEAPVHDNLILELIDLIARKDDDPFLVVEKSDQHYMQTLREQNGWVLENRDGGPDRHYQAEIDTMAEVLHALLDYAHDGSAWQSYARFQRLEF